MRRWPEELHINLIKSIPTYFSLYLRTYRFSSLSCSDTVWLHRGCRCLKNRGMSYFLVFPVLGFGRIMLVGLLATLRLE